MAMRISVAITTFQRRHLVPDAIASAIAQERPAEEIIVVDDGSSDGSADLIEREFGPAVRLVRQRNRGVAAARNAAAALARGDLVAFLDDDDRWLPNHLATIEALARRHPAAVLISTCDNAWFGGRQTVAEAVCLDMAEALLLGTHWVGPPSGVAVRRDAYAAVGGSDEQLPSGEDLDLYLRLSLLGPMALVSAATFERRVQPDSFGERCVNERTSLRSTRLMIATFLQRLETAARDDAAALRRAAGSRVAMEATVAAIAGGARLPISPEHVEALQRRTLGKVR